MEKIEEGTTVLCTYGYNPVLKKPFSFLYDFGYYNRDGNCIVYTHNERNMQDAHCFNKNSVKVATQSDIKNNYWGE